jgi:hypothetical protein
MGARVEEVPARGYAPALFERADGRPLNKAFSWRARRLRRVTPVAEIAAGRVVVVDRRLDANARERAGTIREGGEDVSHGDPDQH